MRTSLVITGACLLLLAVANADKLEKKQNPNCSNSEARTCLTNLGTGSNRACSSACRSAITEYYDCTGGVGLDDYNALCGDAATVGATLFTTISAVLVAVATVLN